MKAQNPIEIVVVGFGNIGRSVCEVINQDPDTHLVGVVSRDPNRVAQELGPDITVWSVNDLSWLDKADVAILCGGSRSDLPISGPYYAEKICTVDSFDTHAHIGEYLDPRTNLRALGYHREMDLIAKATNHTVFDCHGWDPGQFSLIRALLMASLGPEVKAYAFYGLTSIGGLSQGHTNAILQIKGVVGARQFTHAKQEAIARVRAGENPNFELGEMHWRECFVAVAPGSDEAKIRYEIVTMPDYYAPFETTVKFLSLQELKDRFPHMPHDGLVIAKSDNGLMEYRVEWQSNPLATANTLVAYARAAVRFYRQGKFGAFTSLSVPVDLLLPEGVDPISLV